MPWSSLLLARQRFDRENRLDQYLNIFVFRKESQCHTELNIYWTFHELPRRNAKKSDYVQSYPLFSNFLLTVQYIKTIFKTVLCMFKKIINILCKCLKNIYKNWPWTGPQRKPQFPKVEIRTYLWRSPWKSEHTFEDHHAQNSYKLTIERQQ